MLAAALLRLDGDTIAEARLAVGGVALKPWRSRDAERLLAEKRADAGVVTQAAEVAMADGRPSGNNAFKIELSRRICDRALMLKAFGWQ